MKVSIGNMARFRLPHVFMQLAVVLRVRFGAAVQPRPTGHFLTASELRDITSIDCLKAKQADPSVDCANHTAEQPAQPAGIRFHQQLNAGNYPNYKEEACNSGGEFFCDPSGALSPEERINVTKELARLRKEHPVQCSGLQDPRVGSTHFQPFYLGIALAKDWPSSETDPDSLQQFGVVLASEWNMDQLYVGNPIPVRQCPNVAMLVFLPDIGQARLSSTSCEFLCEDNGGGDVAAIMMQTLKSSGPAEAVLAGIRETYSLLHATQLVSTASTASSATAETKNINPEDTVEVVVWNVAQRVFFAVAVVALIFSFVVGACVVLLTPGLLMRRHK